MSSKLSFTIKWKKKKFLTNSLILYIEREIVTTYNTESIINDFQDLKNGQVLF